MNHQPEKVSEFLESFIVEELEIQSARARGQELGSNEPSSGTGAFLAMMVRATQGKNIVELGTGTGVGTLWLASELDESATLTSIDSEAEHIQLARDACDEMEISSHQIGRAHV